MKKIAPFLSLAAGIICTAAPVTAQQWRELGTGNNALNANGSIHALATDKTGVIYAGGAFRSFVGNPNDIFYVAKWNGTAWSQLGTGTAALNANNKINTIATDTSGNVFAAGDFNNVGANHLNYYVAKWNGNTWQELGSGNTVLAANGSILAVATDLAGNVYAAGDFKDETYTYHYVAKWNGSTWTELGTLNANSTIYTLTTDAQGNVYAAGSFTDNNGKIYIAKWNGTSWQQLGDPVSSNLTGVSFIRDIATDASGNVYIAGNITDANNKYYVARLNGNTWTSLGSGTAALNASGAVMEIAVAGPDHVVAAGYFANSSGKAYVARWNGNNWTEVGTGAAALNPNGIINNVLLDRALNVYAAGAFDNPQGRFYVAKYGDSTITPTSITGLTAAHNVTVTPNPAGPRVSVNNLSGNYSQLSILNISGVTLLSQKITRSTEHITISTLQPGVYLLQLSGAKGKATFRFVKE